MDPQHTLFLEHAWDALELRLLRRRHDHTGRRFRWHQHQHVPHLQSALASRHARDSRWSPRQAYQRQRLRRDAGLVQTEPARTFDDGPDRLFYVARSDAPRLSEPSRRGVRHCDCRRSHDQRSAVSRLPVPRRWDRISGWKVPAVRRQGERNCADGRVGVVVLKRLSAAIVDGDHIHAVIRGTAVNNDGSAKVGFTAPGVEGQAAVIREAMAIAGVEARDISYIHAHGTGTHLGDPIEIAALSQAFGPGIRGARCAIGSVKANIGHANTAAGVAGLMTTALALEHRLLPPMANFEPKPRHPFCR